MPASVHSIPSHALRLACLAGMLATALASLAHAQETARPRNGAELSNSVNKGKLRPHEDEAVQSSAGKPAALPAQKQIVKQAVPKLPNTPSPCPPGYQINMEPGQQGTCINPLTGEVKPRRDTQ
ncbi:hypothetical protein [Thermomonas flagellata]|uniref:hypothetical protein n=1 Tax=Thermomonas flagellata TaxID=2888524 RepID=UPI001F0452ED|nr:hypothetical protein [Thermomonas flagellata]